MNASVNKELLTILLGAGVMLDAIDNELSCEKITNKVIAQRQRVFVNSNEKIIYENPLENSLQAWYYDYTKKAPTPKWMLQVQVDNCPYGHRLSCLQTGQAFLFSLFLSLVEKGKQRYTKTTKGT